MTLQDMKAELATLRAVLIGWEIRDIESGTVLARGIQNTAIAKAILDGLSAKYPNKSFSMKHNGEELKGFRPRRRQLRERGPDYRRAKDTVYIVHKYTGEVAGVGRGVDALDAAANAIDILTEIVPDMTSAREMYRLTSVRPDKPTFERRETIDTMPYGRYEGCRFDAIPVSYLDDQLWNTTMPERDPLLAKSISLHLETRPDYITTGPCGQWHEETTSSEVNHLRDFTPSEFNGR